MCGLTGFINFPQPRNKAWEILTQMQNTLSPRGTDDHGIYQHQTAYLAHQRLSIRDLANGHQPLSYTYQGETYTIVYNGEIYNTATLRTKLKKAGIPLDTTCDTELVLKCYARDGAKCLRYLNGIFAFVIYAEKSQTLFLARDQIGVKPLFYYFRDGRLAFASEIKALLAHPDIPPKVNLAGLRELFGIAPARTPGKTVYADIYEVKPGAWVRWQNGKLTTKDYFHFRSRPHPDDAPTTATKLKKKLTKIVARQLDCDVPAGLMLSGGLDSSLITALASKIYPHRLKTFSIDYVGNAENFVPTDFTPTRDNQFIDLVSAQFHTDHTYKLLNSADLATTLREALIARDYPAMADIDSSLLLFCRELKKDITVALSGEFADEIFCGYPWFYRTDTRNATTFPWAIDVALREHTVAPGLRAKLQLKDYIATTFRNAVSATPLSPTDTPEDRTMKTYSYLTMRFFGLNLLERTDRMAMRSALEVRVPFTDRDLVQYVYNIPWVMKNYGNAEKGILRYAFADLLPHDVVYRKKCPYPKTVDPVYTRLVESQIKDLLTQTTHPVWQIVDRDFIDQVLAEPSATTARPWFGQLMNRPQYLAFIYQIALWLELYHVEFDFTLPDTNQ